MQQWKLKPLCESSSGEFVGRWKIWLFTESWYDWKCKAIDKHLSAFLSQTRSAAATAKVRNTTTYSTSTTRNPKIMFGYFTRDGEFGWQASLELLHPSLGFIGHWCGGVLIHKYWVLSSAHCIHKWVIISRQTSRPLIVINHFPFSDLFNLPLPALWTVVLGENNRKVESGYEQRIPVDKIIMHEKYRHFKNDLGTCRRSRVWLWWIARLNLHYGWFQYIFFSVLMKLSRAANLSPRSRVKTIPLPSSAYTQINPIDPHPATHDNDLFDGNENYLRKLKSKANNIEKMIAQVNENEIRARQASNKTLLRASDADRNSTKPKKHRRRNDKFLHRQSTDSDDEYLINRDKFVSDSVDYFDCVAIGWGKYRSSGDLSDVLLKVEVPIQDIKRYFRW